MSELLERKLISAAWGGNYSIIRQLLEKGARINAESNGQTALQAAMRQGHEAIADFLIEQGADVNVLGLEGKSLLMEMVERGNLGMARLLIGSGRVDLNRKESRYGNTALMKAVIAGDIDMVRMLIRAGADVNVKNNMGQTPMDWSEKWGRKEMIEWLQQGKAQGRALSRNIAQRPRAINPSSMVGITRKGIHRTSDVFAITNVENDPSNPSPKGRSRLYLLDEGADNLFSEREWDRIFQYMESESETFGLPERRGNSIVLGSFNLRHAGPQRKGMEPRRSDAAWEFIARICKRFDLMAAQEIKDNLASLRHLQRRMGEEFGYLVSDITGLFPGDPGNSEERLGFLYYQTRVRRTQLASDITIDKTKILEFLNNKEDKKRAAGKENSEYEKWNTSKFIDFMRAPFCATFEIRDSSTLTPYHFLAVNCHLASKSQGAQRRLEFAALVEWLIVRARSGGNIYYPNILVMGDFNLDYDQPKADRPRIDQLIQEHTKGTDINVNFPFLDPHPAKDRALRTNLSQTETYDHIGFIGNDGRLPDREDNAKAGRGLPDDYDYGIFNFAELISQALLDQSYSELHRKTKDLIDRKLMHELSDHLPIWIRLPMPD
jgi:hypothetical protein